MKICEPMPAVESHAPSSKLERKRAAQIRQSDRGQPAIEIGEKRAEQNRDDRKHRLRRDAARAIAGRASASSLSAIRAASTGVDAR